MSRPPSVFRKPGRRKRGGVRGGGGGDLAGSFGGRFSFSSARGPADGASDAEKDIEKDEKVQHKPGQQVFKPGEVKSADTGACKRIFNRRSTIGATPKRVGLGSGLWTRAGNPMTRRWARNCWMRFIPAAMPRAAIRVGSASWHLRGGGARAADRRTRARRA